MIDGVCCFCGEPVAEVGLDPCTLAIFTKGEGDQSWPCHAACYRERLGVHLPYGQALFESGDH